MNPKPLILLWYIQSDFDCVFVSIMIMIISDSVGKTGIYFLNEM